MIDAFLIALWMHQVCAPCCRFPTANAIERLNPQQRLLNASESVSLTPKGLEIAQSNSAPTIVSLSPLAGPIGALVTVRGSHFTAVNFVIFRGAGVVFNAGSPVASEEGDTLRFHVTPCSSSQLQCPTFYVSPGEYSVTVTNENGTSNESKFVIAPP